MKRILREVSRVLREMPAFASRHKVWAGIVIALAFLAVVIFVPRLPLIGPRSGREAESDFRGHLLQALGGLVLAAGAYFTGRTFALNREGQITERFTRAVEQLADDEKLDIRLGGIYALERIGQDSETHYEPVMEVLTAFLREHTRHAEGNGSPESEAGKTEQAGEASKPRSRLRVDFQAAATVLGRRDRRHERPEYRLDLRRVGLEGATLLHADLAEADLSEANLSEANLWGANVSQARLADANLSRANLSKADLSWANLNGANLFRANLPDADLSMAFLRREADLSMANLYLANLSGADLSGANLGANLSEANLKGAKLSGADLSQAFGLTSEQLAETITDEETKLPEYLREAGR
jgi:uncharacterized protein YjbI with pentapeptide repeats